MIYCVGSRTSPYCIRLRMVRLRMRVALLPLTALPLSIFIIIWILGNMVGILHDNRIVVFSALQSDVGSGIHVVSMVFLSLMLWLRYYYSERSGKKIIEDLDATLR
jgi:hypothetical protein